MNKSLPWIVLGLLITSLLAGCMAGDDDGDHGDDSGGDSGDEDDDQTPGDDDQPGDPAPVPRLAARLTQVNADGVDDETVGWALLLPTPDGVQILVSVEGLEEGTRATHIHEGGSCGPSDGTAAGEAGGHFNPFGAEHGDPHAGTDERHAGDLPNLEIDESGRGALAHFVEGITADESDEGVLGRTLVMHAGEDDHESQPAGDAGARIVCGPIEETPPGDLPDLLTGDLFNVSTEGMHEETGVAVFIEHGDAVTIGVFVEGLEAGHKGTHIHAGPGCGPRDGNAAGEAEGHFNPDGSSHGPYNAPAGGKHAGDLPNTEVHESGRGALAYVHPGITLGDGETSILQRTLVLHADRDDHESQPAGDAGARIVCGPILA